jgi:hypothetical protein
MTAKVREIRSSRFGNAAPVAVTAGKARAAESRDGALHAGPADQHHGTPARIGVAFAQVVAEQPWQKGLGKHPDETDQDDGETDQEGVPGQQEVRMGDTGAEKGGQDGRQLETKQQEQEAIQQKDEHLLVNGVNVRPFPARKVENRREPWEATSQTSIQWRKPAGDGTPFLVIEAISKKRI